MIVIIILLIVLSTTSTILVQQFQLFTKGQDLINADWQGRIAMEQIIKNLRNTETIITANTNNITFKNDQGYYSTYQQGGKNNTQLMYLTSEPDSLPAVLADNIKKITFNYYNKNGSKTFALNKIRYTLISIDVENRTTDLNLTTAVFLWNIKT